MKRTTRQILAVAFFIGAGLVGFVRPAFACHEPTGWCCVPGENGHAFCCYFENNQIIGCAEF